MGHALPVRKRAKDAAQARRLLAIAAVLDEALREDAAEIGGVDPSDAAGLGDPIQRARAERPRQHSLRLKSRRAPRQLGLLAGAHLTTLTHGTGAICAAKAIGRLGSARRSAIS
jgi:hypothetical protein